MLEQAISEAADDEDGGFLADLGRLAVRHGDARAAQIMGSLLKERTPAGEFRSDEEIDAALRRMLKLPAEGDPGTSCAIPRRRLAWKWC